MKPEASSGGGGGDRPRYSSHHNTTTSTTTSTTTTNSSYSKDKVRCHSSASSFATSVYRSMSEPGFHMLEPERHREERVVVKAYGNVAPPSPQNLGLLPAHSPSQVVPVAGILEGRDVSGSGRKRPGRKTRRPEGHGGLSPENGFSTSFQIGDMKEGGCKIQAEQICKEAPLRGTNNYASLLSSPSPSSIPNPSFKTKLSFDAFSINPAIASGEPCTGPEGASVHHVSSSSSSRRSEFLRSSDVKYVEDFSPLLASSTSVSSSALEVVSPESSSASEAYPKEDSIGNDSSEGEVSTPPATGSSDLMTRFEETFAEDPSFHIATQYEERSDASSASTWQDESRFSNPKSVVSTSSSETRIRCSNGIVQEVTVSSAESRNKAESHAIGIPKMKVRQAFVKSSKVQNDYTEPRKFGVHGLGTKQSAAEKGIRRSSPVLPSRSPGLKPQLQDSQSHWKAISPGDSSYNLPSVSSTAEGLLECSHSWPGPGSSLLGSPYGSLERPILEPLSAAQPLGVNGRSSSQSKMFSEHWSPEEVNQAIEDGQIFKATFRVNSHNRHEAYVTVEGLPLDLLIDGSPAQNRAMEGDIVAVMVEPTPAWPRLKGSFNKQPSPESATVGDGSNPATEGGKNNEAVSISRVEDEDRESISEVVKDVLRVEGKTSETRCRNFTSKDSRKVLPMQEDAQLLKSRIGSHNNGGLVDQKTIVSRNTVYQILKRPTSENASGPVMLQSSMEKLTLSVESSKGSSATVMERSAEKVGNVRSKPSDLDSNGKIAASVASLTSLILSCPGKRPTAKVVAIVQKSARRESVVGFLEMPQQRGGSRAAGGRGLRDDSPQKRRTLPTMLLIPVDSRCPKMLVPSSALPPDLHQRLKEGDSTVATELVAAKVDTWRVDSFLPSATVVKSLGQGGEIEPHLKAILFENNAHPPDFPQESLDCLPKTPWKIPASEMKKRMDLRRCRIFSIDPPTARDLDDALSIERLRNGVVRIGVHIADVSYFILPGSALDKEAANRSTSIYLEQRVLPMLPRLLCEELCSLNPGVDRLAFSVIWDMNASGEILHQWIGRTVINSCAKLTYEHAQDMIEGIFLDMEGAEAREGLSKSGKPLPQIHGNHSWLDIVTDVLGLHEMAKKRRDSRVEGGALKLNNSKIVFSLDEDGTPYETSMYKTRDSNFVVEEFMLLANMTVAKVISNAFPDSALLRRHPEPNMRKLKEFEEFCGKNEFDLDTSTSGSLRLSLEKMQDRVSHDPVLYNILMVFATKPMQLARYFCTGELKDKEEDWGHYALACPLYTHFTSPIRRYPDVLVHRMLAAALDAEDILSTSESSLSHKGNKNSVVPLTGRNLRLKQCFSSAKSERGISDSPVAQNALAMAADKHKLPASSDLMGIAAHCNERKMASRNVKEASDKLYLWAMLKKKGSLLSDSRVLALGPKFMTLYICKLAMERRIYYDEIEGVNAEWFEATGTLVLDISPTKKTTPHKRSQGRSGRQQRTVADIAMVVNPADGLGSSPEQESYEDIIREVEQRLAGKDFPYESPPAFDVEGLASDAEVEPTVLPLTLRLFSAVPVSLHSIGGGADHRPLDIGVKLYVSSYTT
ncbi:hypothetical protein KC19_2G292800 [Ceratodon purpureus]|uniref:DIS3-like exonuclease 2 n=1 Tax=Ceratodon purpureus TaxID=3225 RepID=A0A8T0J0J2_CERPU|nr:hypothetical protein KC19_2G292800 [Ceratodon purpureus]